MVSIEEMAEKDIGFGVQLLVLLHYFSNAAGGASGAFPKPVYRNSNCLFWHSTASWSCTCFSCSSLYAFRSAFSSRSCRCKVDSVLGAVSMLGTVEKDNIEGLIVAEMTVESASDVASDAATDFLIWCSQFCFFTARVMKQDCDTVSIEEMTGKDRDFEVQSLATLNYFWDSFSMARWVYSSVL